MPKIMVVTPTYNEAQNLPILLEGLLALPIEGLEALVVDDNSPDGTGEIAEEWAKSHPGRVHVIHREGKLGLGTAYILGFRRALEMGADLVIEMDADLSHPPDFVPKLVEAVGKGDVAVGSRYVSGGSVDPRWGMSRKSISIIGNLYARLVMGLKVQDTTSGFKCFKRHVLEAIDLGRIRSEGFAFQVEMAYACQRKGFKTVEVPFFFVERARGKSKISSKIIWEALWRLWQIKGRY